MVGNQLLPMERIDEDSFNMAFISFAVILIIMLGEEEILTIGVLPESREYSWVDC
jgi:hypothetical protein